MALCSSVQDYWDSASSPGIAQQPDNPRPLQQPDDRLLANHLGPAVKPDHTVSLANFLNFEFSGDWPIVRGIP